MDLLDTLQLIGGGAASLLMNIVASHIYDRLPNASDRIIDAAVRRLPDLIQARYDEEWRSHAAHIDNKFGRLKHAAGCYKSAVLQSYSDNKLDRLRFQKQLYFILGPMPVGCGQTKGSEPGKSQALLPIAVEFKRDFWRQKFKAPELSCAYTLGRELVRSKWFQVCQVYHQDHDVPLSLRRQKKELDRERRAQDIFDEVTQMLGEFPDLNEPADFNDDRYIVWTKTYQELIDRAGLQRTLWWEE